MISVQAVSDRMISVLDAEGSDRYLFDQDLKPAINSSIDWLVAVFNSAFAEKKFPEESLRDLIRTSVWQASSYSRIHINSDSLGYEVWTILGIFPEPKIAPHRDAIPLSSLEKSEHVSDLSYISSDFSAERLTIEEWNVNKKNIFSPGNIAITNGFKRYAYLGLGGYNSDSYNSGGEELEIRPSVASQFIAMTTLKVPEKITSISDEIEFPSSVFDVLYQKALNFIAYKQGDKTNLYSVTAQDVATLIKLMI